MSSAEHERLLRRARAQDVALFRYRLIGSLEEGLSTKQRGRVVRGIAGQVHAGPGGRGVQVSARPSTGGSGPGARAGSRRCCPATASASRSPRERAGDGGGAEAGEHGADRGPGAADHGRPGRGCAVGADPAAAFRTRGPGDPAREHRVRPVRGRGPERAVGRRCPARSPHRGEEDLPFAFLDDHSRFITGHRWGWSEDSLHLAAAFKRAVAARGLPRTLYVDNGACFVDETTAVTCAKLGIRITHSPPYRPPLTGQSLHGLPVTALHPNRPV